MEWDSVLLWLVGMSCGMTAFTAARARPVLRGYVIASVLIGAITAGAYGVRPGHAGEIGAVLWGLFLVAPGLLQRRAMRHSIRQRYDRASRWMTASSWLHPADGAPQQARLLRALHRAETGDATAIVAEFDRLVLARSVRISRAARLHRARITHDWAESLDWVLQHVPPMQLVRDPALLGLVVRGLGETGQLSKMLAVALSARLPTHPMLTPARATIRLFALAFSGETKAVDRLSAGTLAELSPATKQFWRGTAELAAGETQIGMDRLTAADAEASTSAGTREMIAHRMACPPVKAEAALTDSDRVFVRRILDEIDHDERFLPTTRLMGKPWATYALIAANVAMFIVEIIEGGATDDATLYRLGAMVPRAAQNHEYYRWFMANFLHYGTAHIVMNMLGLWVLGPFVEFSLGRVKYVAVYLAAGVATMASVGALMVYRGDPDDILIGASGAIMALIGATAAVLLRGWWRGRAKVAGRRLRLIGLILVTQIVFDHFTPQVSGSAHLIGAGWGFILASVIPHRKRSTPT